MARIKKGAEKAKNQFKSQRGLRRAIDDLLINPRSLTVLPGMATASAIYKDVKSATKPKRGAKAVTPCLKKWFTCLTEPFSANSTGACIPAGANVPSARNFGYARFDALVGTEGFGFVAICPTASNDGTAFYLTNAAYGLSQVQVLGSTNNLTLGVEGYTLMNNRFRASAFYNPSVANPSASQRVVGGGLRCMYTGTNLNLKGLYYCYTAPSHQSAVEINGGGATTAALGGMQECIIKPVTREPQEFPLYPVKEAELDYPGVNAQVFETVYPWAAGTVINSGFTFTNGNGVQCGTPTTLIMFTGKAGESFHFELGLHFECIGPSTEGMRMSADSDPVGVDRMMAALSSAQVTSASSELSFSSALRKEFARVSSIADSRVSL